RAPALECRENAREQASVTRRTRNTSQLILCRNHAGRVSLLSTSPQGVRGAIYPRAEGRRDAGATLPILSGRSRRDTTRRHLHRRAARRGPVLADDPATRPVRAGPLLGRASAPTAALLPPRSRRRSSRRGHRQTDRTAHAGNTSRVAGAPPAPVSCGC